MKTERQISSGGVIFRKTLEQTYVALISVKNGKVWTLPKGLVEKGENIARTAHREVKEETGLDGKIIKNIGHIQYFYCHKENDEMIRFFKIVYFFLMEYADGDVQDHDTEVTDCQWFPIDDAIQLVRYEDEKGILKKARDMIVKRTF
ncbi:MAG: NUDIX hydrolase [Deltaproteobacteria bacterium]|nr:NUDIX hydrolase [Deltaproteobacteria bacterium]